MLGQFEGLYMKLKRNMCLVYVYKYTTCTLWCLQYEHLLLAGEQSTWWLQEEAGSSQRCTAQITTVWVRIWPHTLGLSQAGSNMGQLPRGRGLVVQHADYDVITQFYYYIHLYTIYSCFCYFHVTELKRMYSVFFNIYVVIIKLFTA